MRRFAGFYMNEDPEAPNYDSKLKLIPSLFNGSRGPKMTANTQEDWNGLIVEANVIWKYREPSEVRLFGGRANVESTFEGQNYYVTTYGGLEVRHFLSEQLILRVTGLGGVNDYPGDTTIGTQAARRSDVFVEAGVSLKYQMRRWLAFELGYRYLNLNSNFNEFDYTDNRVKASILLSY